ncbi:MAG: phosphotransferase [Deltaproteobacteria bacterium]|nr:phosphotransferase [Deltaproteobacteria bacterium]
MDENFRFLILEVKKQVEQTVGFLQNPGSKLKEKIDSADDYIDNMKSLIEDKSYGYVTSTLHLTKQRTNLMRSVNTIASNLERIGDFAVNVVDQTQYLTEVKFLADYDLEPFFGEIFVGLDLIRDALLRQDLAQAFRICQCEFHLDSLFAERFQRILKELREGADPGDLVTTLFIFRYLERMGDSLLNIGEAVIFAHMGEKLKIHQYQALTDSLAKSGINSPLSQVEFASIWGTRGGCRIGTVQNKKEDAARPAIFKEGRRRKIEEEKANIERWEKLLPGLPPKIYSFQANGEQASLLLEFLPGCTFQEVLLTADEETLANALFLVVEHLSVIWQQTLHPAIASADFLAQLATRRADVARVHPSFENARKELHTLAIPPFGQILARLGQATQGMARPFSVFTHGDFNANNIIYDHPGQRLHFIDVHRSADGDYLQDVSVFLVSIFRIPVNLRRLRERMDQVVMEFFRFAQGFAQSQGDHQFQARLGLGLIRSFYTSTRFEFDQRFAKKMYQRSVYLMERMLEHHPRPWEEFVLPTGVLVH